MVIIAWIPNIFKIEPQLKEFMDATMFYFGLFDSKMEMKSPLKKTLKQGYHYTPGNELAWMDLLSKK